MLKNWYWYNLPLNTEAETITRYFMSEWYEDWHMSYICPADLLHVHDNLFKFIFHTVFIEITVQLQLMNTSLPSVPASSDGCLSFWWRRMIRRYIYVKQAKQDIGSGQLYVLALISPESLSTKIHMEWGKFPWSSMKCRNIVLKPFTDHKSFVCLVQVIRWPNLRSCLSIEGVTFFQKYIATVILPLGRMTWIVKVTFVR